jgi:GNAT superfamily N-acetyltransferase
MIEIQTVSEPALARLVAVRNAVWPHDPLTRADLVDWRKQAEDTTWLVASRGGEDVGAGIGVHGWHSPPGVGRLRIHVLPSARGHGAGTALLAHLGAWLAGHRCTEATAAVFEPDADSLAWAARRGFTEVGRHSTLALDLDGVAAPSIDPPDGIEIVAWADHPDLARALYDVYLEAAPDIPGDDDAELPAFEHWLANDMQGAGDRPEATFVALERGTVVGYAKLSISSGESDTAWHDLTGVRRAWRGRGIAGALKRAEIAWAKENDFRRLLTQNEERNEPVRRLNQRHGYVLEPGLVTVRGRIGHPPGSEAF